MLGSIDCMHWNWKNCPKAWQGMYCGKSRDATIVLEAVASEDLRIGHSFLLCRVLSMISMCCNGLIYLLGLLVVMLLLATTLSMGMNTQRGTILQMVYTLLGAHLSRASKNPKQKNNVNLQGCKRQPKDIERSFGVLQSRFAIVRGPARFWDKKTLKNIMTCCVILHNMILEDERGMDLELFYDNVGSRVKPARDPNRIRAFLQTYKAIENADTHFQL